MKVNAKRQLGAVTPYFINYQVISIQLAFTQREHRINSIF